MAGLVVVAVHGDQAEGYAKALLSFKIILQAPMAILPNGDAVLNAGLYAVQRSMDEIHPMNIVVGGNDVFHC